MTSSSSNFSRYFSKMADAAIDITPSGLATIIESLISTRARIDVVTPDDLDVYGASVSQLPKDVTEAMRYGTCFFDALFYFACDESMRPPIKEGNDDGADLAANLSSAKDYLFWSAVFIMLRGSWPAGEGTEVGKDIPSFLANICGMKVSGDSIRAELASFPLEKVGTEWVKHVHWQAMSPKLRQRFALGLAGYRALGPFRLLECRNDASVEVKAAFEWVREILNKPADWSIVSATRDPALISRLGAWNATLGNLSLLCFTPEELQMLARQKIIFKVPVRDPRADSWRSWVSGGALALNDPVLLN